MQKTALVILVFPHCMHDASLTVDIDIELLVLSHRMLYIMRTENVADPNLSFVILQALYSVAFCH